ncbi:hypothetical protein [Prescottella equi]
MSRNEWESGTIQLPPAAVPGLRRALNQSAAQHRSLILEEVDALWQRIKDRAADKRACAIPNYVDVPFDDPAGERRANALGDAQGILHHTQGSKPTKADLERAFPTPNNRTKSWTEAGFSLTLDGRSLHWDVPETNHAREHAEVTALYQAAVKYLNSITWTRGSGGVIVGNDEYNSDDRSAGGAGNYVTRRFGPATAHQIGR